MITIIKKINLLRKQTNERMDNFISTTKRISERLAKLENEIYELRKRQKKEGLE